MNIYHIKQIFFKFQVLNVTSLCGTHCLNGISSAVFSSIVTYKYKGNNGGDNGCDYTEATKSILFVTTIRYVASLQPCNQDQSNPGTMCNRHAMELLHARALRAIVHNLRFFFAFLLPFYLCTGPEREQNNKNEKSIEKILISLIVYPSIIWINSAWIESETRRPKAAQRLHRPPMHDRSVGGVGGHGADIFSSVRSILGNWNPSKRGSCFCFETIYLKCPSS